MATACAKTRIGRRGCWRDLHDEVVESACSYARARKSGAQIMMNPSPNPSLRELLNSVSTDVQLLASQTLALGRLEISAAASKLASSGVGIVASVFVAAVGVGVLISALVLILVALGVPAWAAASVVGLVFSVGGALSARYFVGALRQAEFGLKETRESLRETVEWLKVQTGA